jgi:MFS family permease
MPSRLGAVMSVFRSALGNGPLRRVGLAYALFGTSEFGLWITLLVFAYDRSGATGSLVMALVQLVPCIALGLFFGAFVDRHRPNRILSLSYGLQAITTTGVALAIGLDSPTIVVLVLAPLITISMTLTRPAQAALLPAIVRTPDELTAANVTTGWTDGAASLVGPALVGVLLGWRGPGLAIGVTAGMTLVALILVGGLVGPPAALRPAAGPVDGPGQAPDTAAAVGGRQSGVRQALASIWMGARANLRDSGRNPQIRVLLALHTFYYVLVGALDLLCVILAINVLHMGLGGAGFLNSAFGGGALLAGFVTAFLVGQRNLSLVLVVALALAVAALAAIGAVPSVTSSILLIGTVGLAGAVFDVTDRTLLQRSVPFDAIAGSFSIREALMDLGLALGAVLVRGSIAIVGVRATLVVPAGVAVVLIAVLWRRLRKIDASATVPHVEIQLLRSIPIFSVLPPPSLEGIAKELEPLSVPSGTVVITEGEGGDRYYAVADGELAVTREGQFRQTVSRGDGFGEIALIRDIPRQASVRAVTDALLFTLTKETFVQTVTGHAAASTATTGIIAGHLATDQARRLEAGSEASPE